MMRSSIRIAAILAAICFANVVSAQGSSTTSLGAFDREMGAGGVFSDPVSRLRQWSAAQNEAEAAFTPTDYRIILDVGVGSNEVTGTATFTEAGVVGTELDFRDDLGLEEESESRIGGQLYLDWFRLDFAYSDFSFAGDENLVTPITILGTTYDIGTNIVTDFDATYYRGYIGFTPFRFNDMFELGFGLSIHLVDSSITFTGTSGAVSVTEQQDAPIPGYTFDLHGGIYLEYISIEPQVGYGVVPETSGVEADILEAMLTVRVHPVRWFGIGGKIGYYNADVTADIDDEFTGTMDITQTYFSGVISFEF